MKKVSFYTLGCKVNQYETQALKEKFESNGYIVVGENDFAHVYVVNSCTVTGIADRKTRQYARKTKKLNPDATTAVVGCYAETGADQLQKIDEVDIVLGTAEKSRLFEEIENLQGTGNTKIIKSGEVKTLTEYDDVGLVNGMDSRTRAYIKIEDGCDRFCSYCIIPHSRGAVRSRPKEDIIAEAVQLLKKGYKELILTGINAALYGTDYGIDSIRLIKSISEIPEGHDVTGDFRIRLSSLEPTVINSEYAKRLIEIPRLCPHLHLSLQSGSDRILSSMNRRYSRKDYLDIVDVLKTHDPNYSVTTDIIVGFPGENDEDFNDSKSIVKEAGFSKVHVFKYSKRPGTVAADMEEQVPGHIKNQRSRELIRESEVQAKDFINQNKGTKREALILEYDSENGQYHGITDNDIDVRIKSSVNIENKFISITL